MTWKCVCGWAELHWRSVCTQCGHRLYGWRLRVRRMPVLDTGIGREAGYANDKELIKAAEAQRALAGNLLGAEFMQRVDAAIEDGFLRGQP